MPDIDRTAWLKERRKHIGASEVAGVLGVSPFASPLSVWAEKTGAGGGVSHDAETQERMRWGHILEPVILREHAEREGIEVEPWPQDRIVRHPSWPSIPMGCTPDGTQISPDPRRNIQVKTTSVWQEKRWEEGIPLDIICQVQAEMTCRNMELSTVLPLFGGQRLEAYPLERDDELIDLMERAVARFWREHIDVGIPPAADAHPASIAVLKSLHPDDNGETITLPPHTREWWERWGQLAAEMKELKAEQESLKAKVIAALGANTYGIVPGGGRFSLKTSTRSEHVVKASKFRTARRLAK